MRAKVSLQRDVELLRVKLFILVCFWIRICVSLEKEVLLLMCDVLLVCAVPSLDLGESHHFVDR